jgi:ABC-type bacteriocin/lantibiotic exporter with double-glycine peptidase domain
VNTTPISTATHVSSTVWHRLWLRSADGREFSRRFPGDAFSATTGQVISIIDSDRQVLMAYNHSTGEFARWFSDLHKLPRALGCLIVPGTALAGFLVLASQNGSAFNDPGIPAILPWSIVGFVWVLSVFIVWAILASILYAIIRTTRNRQFEKRIVSPFRRFLKESTPELLARFRALPT